jgi:hypothetical protein
VGSPKIDPQFRQLSMCVEPADKMNPDVLAYMGRFTQDIDTRLLFKSKPNRLRLLEQEKEQDLKNLENHLHYRARAVKVLCRSAHAHVFLPGSGSLTMGFRDRADCLEMFQEWIFPTSAWIVTWSFSDPSWAASSFSDNGAIRTCETARPLVPRKEYEWKGGRWVPLPVVIRSINRCLETETWYLDGKKHRDGDEPAVVTTDLSLPKEAACNKEWWKHGLLHRDGDQPAVAGQYLAWYKNGKCHRDNDQPAVIRANGGFEWLKDGKMHRDGDEPALVENGDMHWFKDGKRHREGDKPALIEKNGSMHWYKDSKRHRDGDEPAVICPDGLRQWYKYGTMYRDGGKPMAIYGDGTCLYYRARPIAN